jgi:acyl-CoA thioesterase FadM
VARIKLDLPARFPFRTEIDIRESDMNRGGHLANDALFSLLNEARVKFYESLGYREEDVEGTGTIMSDAVIVYKAESFPGDRLAFEVTAGDFSRIGCDLFYRVTNTKTGHEVARAKTAIGFFDYGVRKLTQVPEGFKSKFLHELTGIQP